MTFNSAGEPDWWYDNSVFDKGTYGSTTETQYQEILKRISTIEERLLILIPNEELQTKFPALKDAYEAYKVIEALIKGRK